MSPSSDPFDRTVFAYTADGDEIVRYDRAGKYYVEPKAGARRHVKLAEAAALAAAGTVRGRLPNRPFLRAVERARQA